MKRSAILYGLLLLLLPLTGLIYFLDASRLSGLEGDLRLVGQLSRHFGVSRDFIEEYAARLPAGTELQALVLEGPETHDHEFLSQLSVYETGVEVVFAHLGSGSIGNTGRFLQFTIILVNDSNRSSQGTIQFFDDQGNPMGVPFDGKETTKLVFNLARGEVRRFVSDGPGPVRSGWALVHSDQPISGTLSFGIRDSKGRVFTDVGVTPSPLAREVTIFADTLRNSDTGVGLCNPRNLPLDLRFELRNTEGEPIAVETRQLAPLGHLALFLTQLFKGVPGIDEFEGSVIIQAVGTTSAQVLAGVTLRVTGSQLTSLPVVKAPPPKAAWTTLVFPHMAVGQGAGLGITTSSILFNNTSARAAGMVEYFNSQGETIEVVANGKKATAVGFNLPPGGVTRIVAESQGEIETGWIRVNMDQPIVGTNLFTIFGTGREIVAEAGIPSAILQKNFDLIADSTGPFNTAIALAFALAEEEEAERLGEQLTVDLTLRDSSGSYVAGTEVELTALTHQALFLTELFPNVDGIEEFQGFIEGQSSEYVGVASLRSAGAKVTSLPLFDKLRGFAPVSTFEPAQKLGGTAPAFRWILHQSGNDLALDQFKVQLNGATLLQDSVRPGDQFALGTFVQPNLSESRFARLIVREISSLEFDLVMVREGGLFPQGRGRFEQNAGGVQITLELDGEANTFIGGDADWTFFLPAGLIQLPSGETELSIDSEFVSVSSFKLDDSLIIRRTNQVIDLQDPGALLLQAHFVSPSFLLPGQGITISGQGFSEETLVEIDVGGSTVHRLPFEVSQSSIETLLPGGRRPIAVRLVEGNAKSNIVETYTLFSPSISTLPAEDDPETAEDETGFTFGTTLPQGDLALQSQEITLSGLNMDFAALAVNQRVGRLELKGPSNLKASLFVTEVLEGQVVLEAKQTIDGGSSGSVTIRRGESNPDELILRYEPDNGIIEPALVVKGFQLFLAFFDSYFTRTSGMIVGNVVTRSAPLFSGNPGPGYAVNEVVLITGEDF